MIFKRIGSFCFALGFLLAIVVFTHYGSGIIPKYVARMGMILFGGLALLMNLIALRYDPESDNNYVFWIGTAAIFSGLIMKMYYFPFNQMVMLGGILIVALSYFFNPFSKRDAANNDDLLDQ